MAGNLSFQSNVKFTGMGPNSKISICKFSLKLYACALFLKMLRNIILKWVRGT